jgi:hypothetical protein
MPRPDKGESEKDYVSRFMASPEARTDYPDAKQRAAVAYSMYKERSNAIPTIKCGYCGHTSDDHNSGQQEDGCDMCECKRFEVGERNSNVSPDTPASALERGFQMFGSRNNTMDIGDVFICDECHGVGRSASMTKIGGKEYCDACADKMADVSNMIRVCSWCGAGMGEKAPFDDHTVTHSMCDACSKRQMAALDSEPAVENDDEPVAAGGVRG